MTIHWPANDAAILIWSQLLLLWVVALYYVGRTESVWARVHLTPSTSWWTPAIPRLALLVVATALLLGHRWGRATLMIAIACGLALLLTYARERGREKWRDRGAEIELGLTGAYVLLSALIVGETVTRPLFMLLALPMSERRIAALCFAAAIAGFLVRGATQVVRALLNQAGSLPTKATAVDEVEYNRGRLIGSIERLLLAGVVAAGSYAALGFLVAAKGLVRSEDLKRHDFAEYFLIGTLASTAIAMVAGGLLRLVFVSLW
jgi:hypothetical protein